MQTFFCSGGNLDEIWVHLAFTYNTGGHPFSNQILQFFLYLVLLWCCSFSVFPLLRSRLSVMAELSQLSCHSFPVEVFLSWLSCHCYRVLSTVVSQLCLLWLACHEFPVITFLSRVANAGCPVATFLSWLSCHSFPFMAYGPILLFSGLILSKFRYVFFKTINMTKFVLGALFRTVCTKKNIYVCPRFRTWTQNVATEVFIKLNCSISPVLISAHVLVVCQRTNNKF